jgi:hypothetical protein
MLSLDGFRILDLTRFLSAPDCTTVCWPSWAPTAPAAALVGLGTSRVGSAADAG